MRSRAVLQMQLAAALCYIGEIPTEDAKALGDEGILSLFQFDHYPIAKEHGGPDASWNLKPRFILNHREKTKSDQKFSAKLRRVTKEQEAFRARMLAKSGQGDAPPRPKSRLQSRGFDKRYKKTFSRGTVLR